MIQERLAVYSAFVANVLANPHNSECGSVFSTVAWVRSSAPDEFRPTPSLVLTRKEQISCMCGTANCESNGGRSGGLPVVPQDMQP
jgi:hypothetical protein